MPQLEWISAAGFRSIRQIDELPIKQLNVIVGPNGAGKSNLLGLFTVLRNLRLRRLQYYVQMAGGANELLHFGRARTNEIDIELCFRDGQHQNRYQIRLQANATNQLMPVAEKVSVWDREKCTSPLVVDIASGNSEAGIGDDSLERRYPEMLKFVRESLDNCRTYHFHHADIDSPMLNNAELVNSYPLLPTGENIASFLYSLRQHHETRYNKIRGIIQMVAPFFDDFVLDPLRENNRFVRLRWRHVNHAEAYDVSAMSDGTRRFVALTALLTQPTHYLPPVILIDEPELGLHPAAMTLAASMIKSASVHAQIIVATQSPFFLDQFEPHDVLVADRRQGATEFTRLRMEDMAEELDEFSLGELWNTDKFGGRPGGELLA